uniref:Disease resistance protein n=1 Tax=Vitis vinifera TaxID=29760 RepID=A5AV33_VITVI|nr:hypothetical protein VITISV_008974 [Vitis vinifera]
MFKLWVNQIRDAAYDVEDVIDEFMFQVERKRQQRFNNLKFLNFLHVCMCLHDKLPLVNELNERISVINRTLENILINRRRYGMEDPRAYEAGSSSNIATTFEPWSYSNQMVARKEKRFPIVKETNVVGMKNDVEAIKGKLLRSYFPAESNKSRVLITTRREDIVVDAHSDCYKLQLLGEKESWDLFLNKVGIATILTWPGSEEFKKEIVAKCKGLPLTIVVLGGLLSLKDLTQDSWRKPCFLYCGVFPEDSEIKASELIRLWVAEGFVQKRGKETQEDIAEDYLYELIQRSMIQVADTRDDERVKSCRIHDLLRDLAISEAKEEKLFEVDENIDVDMLPTSVRRLIDNINQTNSPHLRSSINPLMKEMRKMNCPHGGFLRLEFLQMQGMWSLKDLLVEEEVMSNLKTLKIEYCDKMRKFPHGLLQLKKLQRLNLYHISQALMSEVLETRGEDWNRIRLIITSQSDVVLAPFWCLSGSRGSVSAAMRHMAVGKGVVLAPFQGIEMPLWRCFQTSFRRYFTSMRSAIFRHYYRRSRRRSGAISMRCYGRSRKAVQAPFFGIAEICTTKRGN